MTMEQNTEEMIRSKQVNRSVGRWATLCYAGDMQCNAMRCWVMLGSASGRLRGQYGADSALW